MKPRLHKGFTLLEVLVVSAIIALLMAILLPGLHQAREQARRTTCQTNLRSIAVGWHSYLETSRGFFPQGVNLKDSYGGRESRTSSVYRWPKARRPLNRHMGFAAPAKETGVFYCPCDRGVPGLTGSCYDERGTSYSMNDFLVGQNQIPTAGPCASMRNTMNPLLPKLNRTQVQHETRLVLCGDAPWWVTYRSASPDWVDWHRRPGYHNLAFLDGHVSFVMVRKGIYVTGHYTVIPFRELLETAAGCQEEMPEP